MHQIADVEVGCFLSSGVDSSYVVKEISKGTEKVKTFSVGYTEEKYSELPYAQKFSQTIGVENISNKVSADEFFDAVPEIQYMLDEPLPQPRRSPCISWPERPEVCEGGALRRGCGRAVRGLSMPAGGHFAQYTRKVPARCGSWPGLWPAPAGVQGQALSRAGGDGAPISGSCGPTMCSLTPRSARNI